MTEANENEWVKGAMVTGETAEGVTHTGPFRRRFGDRAFIGWDDDVNWVCYDSLRKADDLGDTPERLRPLLREIRREVPGAVVWDDGSRCPMVIHPDGKWRHMSTLSFERSSPQAKFEPLQNGGGYYERIGKEIQQGRVYPTADARRIGREEFGIRIDGGIDVKGKPITWADITIAPSAEAMKRELERAIEQFAAFGTGPVKIDGVPKAEPTRVLTSPIFDTRPKCAQCSTHMDPRHDRDDTCSAECLQKKLRGERDREKREKYAEREGAYGLVRAAEAQSTRLTALRDARIGAAKADIDRPLRRVSIEHAPPLNPAALPGVCGVRGKRGGPVKAPSTWPEGSGDDDV